MARTAAIVVPKKSPRRPHAQTLARCVVAERGRYLVGVTNEPAKNPVLSTTSPSGLQSAAPPVPARALAVASIIISGVCGGLIGYAVTDLQCDDGCAGLATLIGSAAAILAALGVAIVAVLALRAMAEWNAQKVADDLAKQSQ